MTTKKRSKPFIGISIGDINGIGLEVILKTFQDIRILDFCTPIIYASKKTIINYNKLLGFAPINFETIGDISKCKPGKLNVLEVWKEEPEIKLGVQDEQAGAYAVLSLKSALKDLKEKLIDALITSPIDKHSVQSESFNFPGHTEYLQQEDGAEESLMLMISEFSKIGVVTGHLPLKDVASNLSAELILKKIGLLNKSLKDDFMISKPKIAVLSLNPHAGDNGLLGDEENKIIIPAIQQAKSIDILAFGPFPSDGFFGSNNYQNFDGILAMYHDQGLIPAKSFSHGEGTNFTAGLNFVRTSPDHGTAYNIAGKGEANESSFRNSLYKAIEIAKNRSLKEELEANPLPVNKNRG